MPKSRCKTSPRSSTNSSGGTSEGSNFIPRRSTRRSGRNQMPTLWSAQRWRMYQSTSPTVVLPGVMILLLNASSQILRVTSAASRKSASSSGRRVSR